MRVYWRCGVPSSSAVRVLLISLLATACCFIVLYTIVETHTLWRRSHQVELHELANKKYSIALATDVDNPLLHYGIVVDCGSSGSRVFVYFWPPHDGNPKELLNIQQMRDSNAEPVVKKVEPGLSSFADNPSAASEHITPLLEFAMRHIPKNKHQETPLYIMATAGLRLLPQSQQDALLTDLRTDLPHLFPFQLADSHIEVISGKQEGIYAWIAVNYALSKFNHIAGSSPLEIVEPPGTRDGDAPHIRKRTVGMLDMGGGSLQVAFEVPKPVRFLSPQEDVAKSLIAEFNLGCTESDKDHTYRVYVTTFLGFGGNVARTRYEQLLVNSTVLSATSGNVTKVMSALGQSKESPILDPCLPLEMEDKVTVYDKDYYLKGTGDFMACEVAVKPLLKMNAPCPKPPCSMDGMYQPQVNFGNSEFYGFSEFYYTTEDVLRMAGRYDYLKFAKAAKAYCSTPWSTLQGWYEQKLYPKADERRFRLQCFKSGWLAAVLHEGLGVPRNYRKLTTTQLIDDREVQWTLGALVFKTKYFPLRDLDGPPVHSSSHYRPPWMMVEAEHTSLIVILCIVVVVMAILMYIRRLGIPLRRSGAKSVGVGGGGGDMRRVPTMSYFMTEPGQNQDGIVIDQGGYEDTLPFLGTS